MRRTAALLCLASALLATGTAAKPKPAPPPPTALTEPLPASACADCGTGAPALAGSTGADFLAAWNVSSATSFVASRRIIDANGNGGEDTTLTPGTQVFVNGAAGIGDGWVLGWSNPGRVFLQRLDGTGMPMGPAVQANVGSEDLGDNHGTSVTAGAGRVLSTFDSNRQDLPARLMARLFDEALTPLVTAPVELGPAPPHAPTAACLRADGSSVVAWTTWIQPAVPGEPAPNGVAVRQLGPDGLPTAPVRTLAAPKLAVTVVPAITCLSGKGYVVAWHSDQKPLARKSWEVVATWVDPRGKVKGPFRLNADARNDQLLPALLTLSNGSVLAVWEHHVGGSSRIVGRRFSAKGQPFGNEFVLHIPGEGESARRPRLSLLPGTGRFVLGWHEGGRGWVQVFGE
jgi:hypothetical protein